MNAHDEQARNGNGPFTRTMDSATLDAQAATLHAAGNNYRTIATTLGISLGSAYQRVQRALDKAVIPAATEAVQQIITNLQADRAHLEAIRDQLITDYDTGCMIANPFDPDLPPVQDREAALKVAEQIRKLTDQLQKIDDQTARLLGLNQPTQTQVDTTIKYEIIGVADDDLT
jgi:hypothetical protein